MITLKTAGAQRLFDHPVIYRKNFIFLSFAENEGLCDSRFRFLLLSLLLFFFVSCHRPPPAGTSALAPTMIPIFQASSFTLQYFPYYVWCSKYIAVLCGESYLCFPGMASKSSFKIFFTIPVAPVSTGIIVQFIRHTIFVYLYLNSCIFVYFLLRFAWQSCPLVLPRPSCILSLLLCIISWILDPWRCDR